MISTMTLCWSFSTNHGPLMIVGITGIFVWTFGIMVAFYAAVAAHDIQSTFVQRNFGYLIDGFEPSSWWWELIVKKADLFCTGVIAYTSLATDSRSKLLLLSTQASIAYALQLATGPYDDRHIRLLDRMENMGLFVRNMLYAGISLALIFGTSGNVTQSIAVVVTIANLCFALKIAMHIMDDWINTALTSTREDLVKFSLKLAEKRRNRSDTPLTDEELADDLQVQERSEMLVKKESLLFWINDRIFWGPYRRRQLLRLEWNGPGADAVIHTPRMYDGLDLDLVVQKPPRGWKHWRLLLIRHMCGLSPDYQVECLKGQIGDFVGMLLLLSRFKQLPSRTTDLIFFASRAVNRLKKQLSEHPNMSRQPKWVNSDSDSEMSGHRLAAFSTLEKLKMAMLEELFSRLLAEVKEKRELLDTVRPRVTEVTEPQGVPKEATWDVLDRLTNDQLRKGAVAPVQMFKRVDFNLMLARCTEDVDGTIRHVVTEREREKHERKAIYKLLQFNVRKPLAAMPKVNWRQVVFVMDMLPVEELRRLKEDPMKCLDLVQNYRFEQDREENHQAKVEQMKDYVTVEDVNSMVMYLQRLSVEDLQSLLEFAQVLIDFLTFPTNAHWRDTVLVRGMREHENPFFYRSIMRMRQLTRETKAMKQKRDGQGIFPGMDTVDIQAETSDTENTTKRSTDTTKSQKNTTWETSSQESRDSVLDKMGETAMSSGVKLDPLMTRLDRIRRREGAGALTDAEEALDKILARAPELRQYADDGEQTPVSSSAGFSELSGLSDAQSDLLPHRDVPEIDEETSEDSLLRGAGMEASTTDNFADDPPAPDEYVI